MDTDAKHEAILELLREISASQAALEKKVDSVLAATVKDPSQFKSATDASLKAYKDVLSKLASSKRR